MTEHWHAILLLAIGAVAGIVATYAVAILAMELERRRNR